MRVLGHALACGLQAILWFRCAVRVVAYGQHTQPDGTSISMDCRTYMPLLADGLCWWMVWGGGFVGVWACRVCGLVLAGSRMGCGMGLSRRAGCRGSCRRIRVTGGRPRVCPGYAEREGARVVSPPFQGFGAAACYSPTSCRMQYHRRARSSLPGSEWVRASPLGHGRRKSVIIIPRDRACTCSLMGGCVVGWGPDGGRVCAEGFVV